VRLQGLQDVGDDLALLGHELRWVVLQDPP
jgi:hypothetical protein